MSEHDDMLIIEGYCMRDRETVEMLNPTPVWTRKGQPATRGDCPLCGGVVFRLGKTELHDETLRPDPVKIGEERQKRTAPKLERDTVYLSYSPEDEEVAQQIAADLEKSGLTVWLHEDNVEADWTSGVHPALKQCKHLVLVLSNAALEDESVAASWEFFREKRKPIVVAQVQETEPPDRIRRSPRYDFENDYKAALRAVVRFIGR